MTTRRRLWWLCARCWRATSTWAVTGVVTSEHPVDWHIGADGTVLCGRCLARWRQEARNIPPPGTPEEAP